MELIAECAIRAPQQSKTFYTGTLAARTVYIYLLLLEITIIDSRPLDKEEREQKIEIGCRILLYTYTCEAFSILYRLFEKIKREKIPDDMGAERSCWCNWSGRICETNFRHEKCWIGSFSRFFVSFIAGKKRESKSVATRRFMRRRTRLWMGRQLSRGTIQKNIKEKEEKREKKAKC